VAVAVASSDFGQPLLDAHPFTGRAGRQIEIPEQIRHRAPLARKLRCQFAREPAELSFGLRG
jgi:hypothetical protein